MPTRARRFRSCPRRLQHRLAIVRFVLFGLATGAAATLVIPVVMRILGRTSEAEIGRAMVVVGVAYLLLAAGLAVRGYALRPRPVAAGGTGLAEEERARQAREPMLASYRWALLLAMGAVVLLVAGVWLE